MIARRVVASIALLVVVSACTSQSSTVRGVVIDVTGDITSVEEFVLRLGDGSDQRLVPAPGITFHDGAAIGHLRDHLRSGQEIVIDYEILDDGTWLALRIDDG